MKRSIVSVIVLAALSIMTAQAADVPPESTVPAPGSPGTATPAPYPQVITPSAPKSVGIDGSSRLLPPIKVPTPPKDQELPGMEDQTEAKARSPSD